MWREKETVCSHFLTLLKRATNLGDITTRKVSTNPSYIYVLTIMSLWSGLQEDSNHMEGELDFLINYDEKFVDQPQLNIELLRLGRTTEESIDRALSISEEYLCRLSDVDDVFQDSKAACLCIAEDIKIFVNNADKVRPAEAEDLGEMRGHLRRKFAKLKSSWENLLREALENNETVIFTELEELVETTETAAEEAFLGFTAILQKLLQQEIYDWSKIIDMSDTPDDGEANNSGDNRDNSTLRHNSDEVQIFYIQDLFATMEADLYRNETENNDEDGSLPIDTQDFPRAGNSKIDMTTNGADVVADSVSDCGQETNNDGAGHEISGLDKDEMEGLAQLEEAFEDLRSHMSTAWNKAMVWVEDELIFTEMNTLMTVARDATDKVIEAML